MAELSLRAVIGGVAVAALLFNTAYAYAVLGGNGGNGGWLGNSKGNGGGDLGALTVRVPDFKLYDLITYDYHVFAEMYGKNVSSGQWQDYSLVIDGQMKRSYNGVLQARDGFWVPHQCVEYDTDTTAVFTLYINASDAQPLTIGGNLQADRKEYIELDSRKTIDAYTTASVGIDRLPRYNVPLNFQGWIDAYNDPNKKADDTVDGEIFADGQTVKTGDNGTFDILQYYPDYGFYMGTRYNWSAEAAQKISDIACLRINITAMLYGADTSSNTTDSWLGFNETVWVSSACPFPVKRYSRNDLYSEDTDRENNTHISRTVLEIDNTLMKNGYTKGTAPIPWGDPAQADFNSRHPKGEFTDWQYTPSDGSGIQGSSFEFGVDEAVKEALANSTGLQNFVNEYNRPGRNCMVDYSTYNATLDPTDINGKAGVYRWNLSFSVVPDDQERQAAHDSNSEYFRYNIVVMDNVTWTVDKLRVVYRHNVSIEHDWGPDRGWGTFNREHLATEGVTLASSEQIMMLDDTVKGSVTNSRTGDIDWKQSTYNLGAAGMGSATPGLTMLETLTGMTFPSVDYAWAVQTQTLYNQGHTFGAAVDVETGQMVYVMDISGTALLGIFGSGGGGG